MPRLRVLSWNIRTFGTHPVTEGDLRNIAQIMAGSQADIVCIQELMTGKGIEGQVGSPISQGSIDLMNALRLVLASADPGADWQVGCSGVNSGKGRTVKKMRDAYAFLMKGSPSRSANAHSDPVAAIQPLSDPVILRQPGNDNFKGRRPGMITVYVVTKSVTPVNIVSFHAATPCNTYSKGKGAGYSIASLATLPEVGGGMLGVRGPRLRLSRRDAAAADRHDRARRLQLYDGRQVRPADLP